VRAGGVGAAGNSVALTRAASPGALAFAMLMLGDVAPNDLEPASAFARCTLAWPFNARYANYAYFTGTASADTVAAGPSPTPITAVGGGHFATGVKREAYYGQVIAAERFVASGLDGGRLARPRSSPEVVLVPWDYSPSCERLPWGRSARWITPGARGLFYGTLRDTSQWISGRPTFDIVGTQFVPYPAAGIARLAGARPQPAGTLLLSADELLGLLAAMPAQGPTGVSSAEAELAVQDWVRDNPNLAAISPAREILGGVFRSYETHRVRRLDVPVAGLYRLVLNSPSGDSVVFYARTAEHPQMALWSEAGGQTAVEPPAVPRAVGYYFVANASRGSDLPLVRPTTPTSVRSQGYFVLVERPVFESADSTVWAGGIELERVAGQFSESERLHADLSVAQQEARTLRSAA